MLKKVFNKWTILTLFLAIVIAGYMLWKNNQQTPVEAKYTLQSVEMGDITQSVSANGTLNPLVLVTVGTQIS